jgi:hypothetical protein
MFLSPEDRGFALEAVANQELVSVMLQQGGITHGVLD